MQVAFGFLCLGVYFIKARNVVVPLQQRGRLTAALDGAGVELPHRIDHGMVVRVEDVLLVARMAGDMNLRDAMRGDGIHVVDRIELVIHGRDIDVVHIQKNAAISALDDFIQELPFGHLRAGEGGVGTNVFDGDRDFEVVLNVANTLDGALDSFPRIRQRKQVVRVGSIDRTPAQVVAQPRSVCPADELLQAAQVFGIGCGHRAEVHGYAMLHDAILLQNLIEDRERAARIDHEILRDDLEPVDDRLARKDVPVMRNTQTDADAVIRVRIETIAGH